MAVGRGRISTEDHPQTSVSQCCPTRSWFLPPSLGTGTSYRPCQQTETQLQLSQALTHSDVGMPSAHRAPPGLGLCFLPPGHTRGQEQRQTRAQRLSQTPLSCFVGRQELFCSREWMLQTSLKGKQCPLEPGHPFTPRQHRTEARAPEASLQAIPSSLSFWVCLGCVFA